MSLAVAATVDDGLKVVLRQSSAAFAALSVAVYVIAYRSRLSPEHTEIHVEASRAEAGIDPEPMDDRSETRTT